MSYPRPVSWEYTSPAQDALHCSLAPAAEPGHQTPETAPGETLRRPAEEKRQRR